MKKIILTAIAVFALNIANAQDKNEKMSFGVKGGVNFATITNEDDTSMKVGFFVGGFGEFMLSEKFAIQPELLYSTQGAKYKASESYGNSSYTAELTMNLAYLNVPIMAKYYANEKFSLEAGPYVGFLLSAKADYDIAANYEGQGASTSGSEDIKDQTNTVDFGLGFGAGYNINSNINVGLRYNIGLVDLGEDDDAGSKNSVLQLSFGYKF